MTPSTLHHSAPLGRPSSGGNASPPWRVAVVGGGPAGLMAAETLAAGGAQVDVFDAMPSVGRKFLLAGKGGLNLTHAEPRVAFQRRYGPQAERVAAWLEVLSPEGLRAWAQGLGIATFVGSSGKVFPAEMKAAPLLRAWLSRLRAAGVRFHQRHRWQAQSLAKRTPNQSGWTLSFETPQGPAQHQADALVLALGGGSWARLGSDGAWVAALQQAGVPVTPLAPSNCGFDIGWSAHLTERWAGTPLKNVRLACDGVDGEHFDRLGECVLTATGLEGQLVYAASRLLRERLAHEGQAPLSLDLLPHRSLAELHKALASGQGTRSMANHLKEKAGLSGAPANLLREGLSLDDWNRLSRDPGWLAARIKALPLLARAARPLDEAISSAGGVRLDALDQHLMVRNLPGLFCAGEMLDWDAPTGGYLLTASMASGRVAGEGVLAWCGASSNPAPTV
ncbi:MAG: aminoacetone oxidase family FAD-binding enzyme [Ideonella sp. MAG2]|nr:MAG: aminoacetone oxidase family FAD-binding enzyme [Ideonella sp. MAG2]